eukprot:TRINITY_DN43724_c0_g1_i1.p1 TRINITY_DN43724_c0_g1~~TRINITY_DN43724_c0_g1_i1.p1  ORF type:complete len:429 (+),score=55.12 TRINITY_DN43724_c0_g1_i1:61-1347(+)
MSRRSACLSLAHDVNLESSSLQETVRSMCWPERALKWHDSKVSHGLGCGFVTTDMYADFSESTQHDLPPPLCLHSGSTFSPTTSLEICCSFASPAIETRAEAAELLLKRLQQHFQDISDVPFSDAKVLLISRAAQLPLMQLPNGLVGLGISAQSLNNEDGLDRAIALMEKAGMFLIHNPISSEDVATLLQLVRERVQDAEAALRLESKDIGCGDLSYAEICGRGKLRWDLLLHALGERVGSERVNSDQKYEVLERIATCGAWVPMMHAMLGEYKWQASVICSRAGAPAGKWHIDGGHGRYVFDGESGKVYAICVFIPLVDLEAPVELADGSVQHGFGCTAFWPGSHRYAECAHLGKGAAEHLRAVISGAPMQAGAALIYDYRTVHCATPNDAFHKNNDGERPILQLTYSFHAYDDVGRNYGYYQLFCD